MDIDVINLGAVLFALTPLTVLFLRIFVLPDRASLDDVIAPRMDLEWPAGIQEEESVRWRDELFTPGDRHVPAPTTLPAVTAERIDGASVNLESKPAV